MAFFRRDDEEESPERQRIEAGGITSRAEERLKALSVDGALFTSELSVNEYALLNRLGPQPLAQVMGASVVRPGWQYLPALPPGMVLAYTSPYSARGTQIANRWGARIGEASPQQMRNYTWHTDVVCELDELTDAWNLARRRALERLTEEALQVGADAVVGVHLRRSDHDLGAHAIEYVVTGTAIRLPGSDRTNWPVLTDVSVQDYWRLTQAGHEPVGLLATTSVVFASAASSTRLHRLRTTARNQELPEITSAFQAARATVRARLQGQLDDAHGAGAVGVTFSHAIHRDKLDLASSIQSKDARGWHMGRLGLPYYVSGHADASRRGWVITMHAAGTAIRPRSGGADGDRLKTTIRMGGR